MVCGCRTIVPIKQLIIIKTMNTTSVTYGSHSSKIASFGRYGLHLIYSPNGKIIPVGTVPSYLLPFPKFDSMGEAVTYCVKEIEKNGDGSHLG